MLVPGLPLATLQRYFHSCQSGFQLRNLVRFEIRVLEGLVKHSAVDCGRYGQIHQIADGRNDVYQVARPLQSVPFLEAGTGKGQQRFQ